MHDISGIIVAADLIRLKPFKKILLFPSASAASSCEWAIV